MLDIAIPLAPSLAWLIAGVFAALTSLKTHSKASPQLADYVKVDPNRPRGSDEHPPGSSAPL